MKINISFFLLCIFFGGHNFAMCMQEKLRDRWQDDKELCFSKMKEAIKTQKAIPYVHQSGELRAWFDGDSLEIKTFFDDATVNVSSFGDLYDLLERPSYSYYLCDGIVYNAENNMVDDWSIDTMHKHDEKKEKKKVNKMFTFVKKKLLHYKIN